MNKLVQQAIEFGLMTHFERRTKLIMHITLRTKPINTSALSTTTSISMKELHFLFILYGIGVSISIIIFVGEIFVKMLNVRSAAEI